MRPIQLGERTGQFLPYITRPVRAALAPRPLYFGGDEESCPPPPAEVMPVNTARKKFRTAIPSTQDTFTYSNGQKTVMESLIGGGQIFQKVDELLDKAKSSVVVDLYNLQNPALYPERTSPAGTPGAKIQAEIIDRLVDLSKKGLAVKVIIDNHWDPENGEGHNSKTIAYLKKNGVDVATYPDFAKISHVKAIIVDNKYAVVGGMNWGNHSATNHDAAVYVEGPDVRNIYNEIFKADWLSAGRKASDIPRASAFDEGKIKVLTTTPREAFDGPQDEIYHEIIKQIGNAKESIYAELFVLTQADIVDNLIFAHHRLQKEGKEGVKILADPGLFFAFANSRKGLQKLAKAGIPVQFYAADRDADEKLHSKWAVFDKQKLLIGSANWSAAGLLTNHETTPADKANPNFRRISRPNHESALLIDSQHLSKAFVRQFWYDWEHAAFPILEHDPKTGKWVPIKPAQAQVRPQRGGRLNQLA